MSELVSPDRLGIYANTVQPIVSDGRVFVATTNIGLRPSQEDRFVLVPCFFDPKASFCGVFDGTVGDHASDFISRNIVSIFCSQPAIRDADTGIFARSENSGEETQPDTTATRIRDALKATFLEADQALLAHCAERGLHYASSTGVAAFLWGNLLSVAHVGDSKACIAKQIGDQILPEWLTVDHKPNMPHELARIEQCGGSLVWLHGNKPFIRGGDFVVRQAAGEHPKQLNYSRAFGGKDLKMYGLSAEPDISCFEITPTDRVLLLASDGLWDVIHPKAACEIAIRAHEAGRSATNELARIAVEQMPSAGVRDNITVIAIFLNERT